MRHIEIPGGWWVDAHPDGAYVALLPATRQVMTHLGVYETPKGMPLTPRLTTVAGFRFAGQSWDGPGTVIYDQLSLDPWSLDPRTPHGVGGAIYDRDGHLHILEPRPHQTSQGYRYVAPDGTLVLGDATLLRSGVSEYTDLSEAQDGSLLVGQGHALGGIVVWDWARLLDLRPGALFGVRGWRIGDRVAVCGWEATGAHIWWTTVAELRELSPLHQPSPSPSPSPDTPPEPKEPETTMRYGNYEEYFKRRWVELRVVDRSEALAATFAIDGKPVTKQETINALYDAGDPRGPAIGNALLELQGVEFVRILSELHHVQGHKDVGGGRKVSGKNFQGMAEDIVCLKPIDSNGKVVSDIPLWQGDVIGHMSGIRPFIAWAPLEEHNPERTWVMPPALDGIDPKPNPKPEPDPKPNPKPDPKPIEPIDDNEWEHVLCRALGFVNVEILESNIRQEAKLEQLRQDVIKSTKEIVEAVIKLVAAGGIGGLVGGKTENGVVGSLMDLFKKK